MSNYSDTLLNDVLEKSFIYKIGKEIKIEFNSYPKHSWIIGAFDERGGFGVESCSWTSSKVDSFPKHIYFEIDDRVEQKEIYMELFGKKGLLNAYDSGLIYSISNIVKEKKVLTPELFTYLKGLFDFYHDKCFSVIINKHYDNDDCCLGLSILCNKDYSQWFENLFIENEELVKHLETNKKYDITEEVKSYYE
jgi:hypothetical protein